MAEVDINQSYRWLGGIFRQVFSLQGDISPTQITADQDDYNPTGLSTAAILRLSTDATRSINGIAGGADGRIIKIVNVGTQGIVLKDEATTSTAANRFALNSDITISESQAVELWYDSTSSRWRLFGGTGGTTVVAPDQESGLVSGGTVTWIVNYDYEVSESFYYIDGVLYHSPRTTVTLDAADPTDDRIDLFVLTTSNTATKVTGTASTPPAEPSYDPSTQLKISFATVDNGTTQPTVTQTWIYRENAGTPTEWAYTDNTANLNPASTTNPYAGTIDIEGTSVAVNDYFELTPATVPTFGTYDALVFKIRSKANWTNTRFITVRFYSGTTAVGSPAQLGGGSFGFDSTNTTDYQNVTIPLTTFGSFTTADRVRFIRTGSTGTIGFYIDDIQLMLTGTGGTTTLIPINGLLNATNVNTIENLNYAQVWQWNTLAGSTGLKFSSSSTLAASNLQKILEISLSGANATSSQTTYGIDVLNSHTGTSALNYGIRSQVQNGTGSSAAFRAVATTQRGYDASVTSGEGVHASATSGRAIYGDATGANAAVRSLNVSTSTNTYFAVLDVNGQSSGTTAAGFAPCIDVYTEASDGSTPLSTRIASVIVDPTAATITTKVEIRCQNSNNMNTGLTVEGTGTVTPGGRLSKKQGADVASVAGAIALGFDGNTFELTGTNAVTLISNVGWANGNEITLLFTSTASLTDGTANSGTDIGMELAGSTNFNGTAGASITLQLSEIGGTQRWREKCRSVN